MIDFQSLTKKFDQRGIAGVHDVSLTAAAGEVVAIMGPNGSGKSTLLNLITGRLAPDGGEIRDGKGTPLVSFAAPDPSQNVQKFLMSCVRSDLDPEKKVQLARDMADVFEFTFQLRQDLGQLSQGQAHKVLLAAQLIDSPGAVLLDEPFTHLDPQARQEILQTLFTYIRHRGMTVVWVTHELNEALAHADRVGIMNFGKLVQLAAPLDLIAAPANLFVARFLGYQNFVTVTSLGEGRWQTPWGEWDAQRGPVATEAVLVVPDGSWELTGPEAQVLSLRGHNLGVEVSLEYAQRTYKLHLPPNYRLKDGTRNMAVSPRWEECLLIPL